MCCLRSAKQVRRVQTVRVLPGALRSGRSRTTYEDLSEADVRDLQALCKRFIQVRPSPPPSFGGETGAGGGAAGRLRGEAQIAVPLTRHP